MFLQRNQGLKQVSVGSRGKLLEKPLTESVRDVEVGGVVNKF